MTEDHVYPVHGVEEHSVMEYGLVPRDLKEFSVRMNRHFCSIDLDATRSFYSPLVDNEEDQDGSGFCFIEAGRFTQLAGERGIMEVRQ